MYQAYHRPRAAMQNRYTYHPVQSKKNLRGFSSSTRPFVYLGLALLTILLLSFLHTPAPILNKNPSSSEPITTQPLPTSSIAANLLQKPAVPLPAAIIERTPEKDIKAGVTADKIIKPEVAINPPLKDNTVDVTAPVNAKVDYSVKPEFRKVLRNSECIINTTRKILVHLFGLM